MEYTKGKWEVGKAHTDTIYNDGWQGKIAYCYSPNGEANAQLIAAAVNACVKVNPDNPMAAAGSLTGLYDASRKARDYLRFNKGDASPIFDELDEAIAKAEDEAI